MATATSFSTVPEPLLQLLTSHLPNSLPLLRRLQFAKHELTASHSDSLPEGSHIVFSASESLVSTLAADSHANASGEVKASNPAAPALSDSATTASGGATASETTDSVGDNVFTVAWVNLAGQGDTQMWLYSTLEDEPQQQDSPNQATHDAQISALVTEIIRLKIRYGKETKYPGCLLLGSVHSRIRVILEGLGRVRPRASGDYDKWLFHVYKISRAVSEGGEYSLPDGMHWSTATRDDCRLVVSKTDIPRQVYVHRPLHWRNKMILVLKEDRETLFKLPNLVVKLEDDTPIAWAFLGPDASLMSLQCEEPYRKRGIAKALAAKLFTEGTHSYGDDGWCSADVSAENQASRGMCKSLAGEPHWIVSWVLLDIAEEPAANSSSS